MKFLFDGLSVTFTPEKKEDWELIAGFAFLDGVNQTIKDSASRDRLAHFCDDYDDSIVGAINLLKAVVESDPAIAPEPPEDEEDGDDFPNDVPLIGGYNI